MVNLADRTPVTRFARLALPALGVLAAEPLYLLVDTAVVGHLGALPLAGLSVGGVIPPARFEADFPQAARLARQQQLLLKSRKKQLLQLVQV